MQTQLFAFEKQIKINKLRNWPFNKFGSSLFGGGLDGNKEIIW